LAGLTSAAIHLLVASVFVARYPLRSLSIPFNCVCALPSLAASGIAAHFAGPHVHWPLGSHLVFFLGAALTAISIWHLGRSFAVLPTGRPIVTGGIYRVLRHPMYFGELLMVIACCTAHVTWYTTALMILAFPAVMCRIVAEESSLQRFDASGFSGYAAVVRWRLFPLIW
jgi:protein-S-isoprenylcysteine O-methyltransferase Ste14